LKRYYALLNVKKQFKAFCLMYRVNFAIVKFALFNYKFAACRNK
jgi:hypothetical protein